MRSVEDGRAFADVDEVVEDGDGDIVAANDRQSALSKRASEVETHRQVAAEGKV